MRSRRIQRLHVGQLCILLLVLMACAFSLLAISTDQSIPTRPFTDASSRGES